MSEHNIRLRFQRQIHAGSCAICRAPGIHAHYDEDLQGGICKKCAPHVKAAEYELLYQHMSQPPVNIFHL